MEEGSPSTPPAATELEPSPESFEEHDGIIMSEGALHQIAYSDLKIGKVVGEGAYGVVMKGKYFGAKVIIPSSPTNPYPTNPQKQIIPSFSHD